jgi:hypothetical protein
VAGDDIYRRLQNETGDVSANPVMKEISSLPTSMVVRVFTQPESLGTSVKKHEANTYVITF